MFFLDTSALAKAYVVEKGSTWVSSIHRLHIIVGVIIYPEIYSALTRRVRGGSIAPTDYAKTIRIFDYDVEHYFRVIEINRKMYQQAGKLAEKHGLRAYDSVQLACALKANELLIRANITNMTFVTADKNLLQAGLNEGLQVDNPENH